MLFIYPLIYKNLSDMGFNTGLDKLNLLIEAKCKDVAPWKIIGVTAITTYSLLRFRDFLSDEEFSVGERAKRYTFSWIRAIPMVKRKVDEESQKIRKSIEEDMNKDLSNLEVYYQLPKEGRSGEEVFSEANSYFMLGNTEWKKGSMSGAVYNYNIEANKLFTDVYGLSALTNPLHPDMFPGIRKMEAEVIAMCVDMFHGGPNACGVMSSGGTESILLACKAYRDYARQVKGIKYPEIVCPTSAHAAFVKAAQIFRMRLVLVPVDPQSYKVDLKAMEKAINRNTGVLVGSAPGFPHGVMDPIVDIAALGKKYNIPVHVDACLGGFIIPFMEEAGYPLPLFDFRVDGVTSISIDSHKYGYAPKGTSIVLYSDPLYRKYQFFIATEWSGGIYASPTFAGSRPGALVATCWAAMMFYGRSGYVEATKKIVETQRYIEQELREIEGIRICGKPEACVVAVDSVEFDIYRLSDAMAKKGWSLNALQFPSSIHLCVTYLHTAEGVAKRFVDDVRELVAEIRRNPQAITTGSAAVYGMSQSIPDRSMVGEIAAMFLETIYTLKSKSE